MAAAANTEATLSKRRFSDFQRGKRQKAEKATKMKVEKPKQRGINNSTLYRVCQQVLNSVTSYRNFHMKMGNFISF